MNGAVDGSVVYVENTGGETSCLSCAYGPTANMLVGSLGEYIPEDAAVKESKPPGDWVADGGSD